MLRGDAGGRPSLEVQKRTWKEATIEVAAKCDSEVRVRALRLERLSFSHVPLTSLSLSLNLSLIVCSSLTAPCSLHTSASLFTLAQPHPIRQQYVLSPPGADTSDSCTHLFVRSLRLLLSANPHPVPPSSSPGRRPRMASTTITGTSLTALLQNICTPPAR